MKDQQPILIAGPTAGGKSGLAVRLAERYGGMVINADSMQVYRELRILTARPDPGEEAHVPHALYGFVPGRERYSAGRFAADAAQALETARSKGLRPIIVGGTGLYFKTLIEGLSPMPEIDEPVRARWREVAAGAGPGEIHRILSGRDPEMAGRLAPGDTQRIVRALEVIDQTGVSLAAWQRLPREPVLSEAGTIRIVVAPERADLVRRIDARFDTMLKQGALDEVRGLAALKLDPSLPIMSALGVRPLLRHLARDIDLAEATQLAKAETRHYAKRQMTWVRGNMISWTVTSTKEMQILEAKIVSLFDQQH
jgi:tRNA dimethylallyltransferase